MAKYSEPVVSRETRLLLTTIVVSVLALWVLARIRFQERPVNADPVPPVLAQLRPQSSFDDLARSIAEMRPSIAASVFALDGARPALRFRPDAAMTLGPVDAALRTAFDQPTGLAVLRSEPADSPGLMPWAPRVLDYPRYLVAAEFTEEKLALRPVFIGGLFAAPSTLWGGDLWRLPRAAAIQPGTFVFTSEGAFAGLAVREDDGAALVPATHLLRMADDLLRNGARRPGHIGVSVQSLTGPIAAATGVASGIVVTWIDADGPASGILAPFDVIESVDGQDVRTPEQWRARVERLSAGEPLSLRIRRDGTVRDAQVQAVAAVSSPTASAAEPTPALGLTLRSIPKVGAEVTAVEPSSRAAAAGLQPGDVITIAGEQSHPTAAQLTQAFAALPEGGSLLLALSRGRERHVFALQK
jgi:hypothetical protein